MAPVSNNSYQHVGRAIRWLLTVWLIYNCSKETGPWTTGALVLIFLFVEVQTFNMEQIRSRA